MSGNARQGRVDPITLRPCCASALRQASQTRAGLDAEHRQRVTEVNSLKRRLRQYAATLDAVSSHAKDEVATALSARNAAMTRSAQYVAERDALQAALKEAQDKHEALTGKHGDLEHKVSTMASSLEGALSDLERLRGECERLRKLASENEKVLDGLRVEKSAADSALTQLKGERRAAMEDRDLAMESVADLRAQLSAVERELALMKQAERDRQPPDIPAHMRTLLAEETAQNVENKALNLIRALAGGCMEFVQDKVKENETCQ